MQNESHVELTRRHLVLGCAGLALAGCGPRQLVKLGFIGGLSDRNADNWQACHSAVVLAVEHFNREGGLDARLVELVTRDAAQNPETARKSARALLQAGVGAVIGPFTSSMAAVIVPILGQAGIFEVSPTITSMSFHGQDGNLFRINRTTRDNARDYARTLVSLGQPRIALAHDIRNRNFTESWRMSSARRSHPARPCWWPTSRAPMPTLPVSCSRCSSPVRTDCPSSRARSTWPGWSSMHASRRRNCRSVLLKGRRPSS
jgi:Periplasmic binding protein